MNNASYVITFLNCTSLTSFKYSMPNTDKFLAGWWSMRSKFRVLSSIFESVKEKSLSSIENLKCHSAMHPKKSNPRILSALWLSTTIRDDPKYLPTQTISFKYLPTMTISFPRCRTFSESFKDFKSWKVEIKTCQYLQASYLLNNLYLQSDSSFHFWNPHQCPTLVIKKTCN